ncbi:MULTISPECIES: ABC transporter substrate-binding protein [unclassified Acidisoma]|jgi:peptide/nickel transport system substrate-binding protein|uniref:ABC transporter substrate-binding protein n=1 Tax=unclassified Acidisoma TaxID=2634065 RepID=UPI00131B9CD2|nr:MULTISPECIES: ABC transporter substrate-binding protein [unclassified Acidisoma]
MTRSVDGALTDLVHGKLSRRDFAAHAAALGLSVTAISALLRSAPAEAAASDAVFPITGPMQDGSGGTLVVGQESNWDVLDPCLGTGAVTWRTCLYQIYESLVAREMDNPSGLSDPIVPGITKSIDRSSDGKTYTFHLQDGVTFSDGTPFDAAAVMWNVERQWDQSKLGRKNAPQFDTTAAAVRSWFWNPAQMVSMTSPNPGTVVFELAKPFAPFVSGMPESGLGTMGMSSPAVWKTGGTAAIAAHPIGTGPFLFESQSPGDQLNIVKNPKYWNPAGAAKADRIIFKALTDPSTRVAALRGGDAHVIFAPPTEEIASLQREGFIVTARANPHLWYMQLNAHEPYWKDRRVRQAFFMSINRNAMAKRLMRGTALPAVSINGRTCPSWTDQAGYPEHNIKAAKQLLADAGLEKGFETTFQIPTGGSGEMDPVGMAEWIARDAAQVGIKIKLQTMEWISYLHAWAGGMTAGIGMNQQSWGMTSIYWPNLPLRTTSALNVGHQPDTRFDVLLDQANSSLDDETAIAKYRAVDALNAQEMWLLPIVNDLAPVVISPKVRNFVHSSDWWWDFKKVWVQS